MRPSARATHSISTKAYSGETVRHEVPAADLEKHLATKSSHDIHTVVGLRRISVVRHADDHPHRIQLRCGHRWTRSAAPHPQGEPNLAASVLLSGTAAINAWRRARHARDLVQRHVPGAVQFLRDDCGRARAVSEGVSRIPATTRSGGRMAQGSAGSHRRKSAGRSLWLADRAKHSTYPHSLSAQARGREGLPPARAL